MWDGKGARVVVGSAPAKSGTATIDGEDPVKLAKSFTDGFLPALPALPSLPPIPGLPMPDFGSTPSSTAYVVVNHPLANGSAANGAADEMAKGLADHISSTFAEAEGVAVGDPTIQAGEQIEIKGVPKQFGGKWTVTNARHVFDPEEQGYMTHFVVSGRSDRSLFALASGGGGSPAARSQIDGLVCGVVTNVRDPDKHGRVKLALPWLSPAFETDWARVAHLSAGARTGAMFLPEVGDEVLVGFESGDLRQPVVLGGLFGDKATMPTIDATTGEVPARRITSRLGHAVELSDGKAPAQQHILLALEGEKHKFRLGKDKVDLEVPSGTPLSIKAGDSKIAIGQDGSMNIEAMNITIKATSKLALEGVQVAVKATTQLSLEGTTQAALKGTMTQIDGTATLALKGGIVQIN
jgi:uncharacterized protein involved in type VI secretion and phage assembly